MKKFLLLLAWMSAGFASAYAQVHIEPVEPSSFGISLPVENQLFAEYRIISESGADFLYIDTCDMIFCGWGNFSALSLREVTLLVDSQFRLMQMELPGSDWQFYPMVLMGFPGGGTDTAIISFFADIPNTNNLIEPGDYLMTNISCRFFFSSSTWESHGTNSACGQILNVVGLTSVREMEMRPDTKPQKAKTWLFDKFNILGQKVK